MTLEEGVYVLSRITYKPGWTLRLHEKGLYLAWRLSADATRQVPMYEGDTLTIERETKFDLSLVHTDQCLIDIIHSCVTWLEMHELDEWFKVNNIPWHEPHAYGREKAIEAGLCTRLTADR